MKQKVVIFLLMLVCLNLEATTYYVSNNGDDSNIGTSPQLAWKTLDKVNFHNFNPGDSILFKRGDIWRGQLFPYSGDSISNIYYGAYGVGDKPTILGSVNLSNPSVWKNIGENIWRTAAPETNGTELLHNSSFDVSTDGWDFWLQNNANVNATRDTVDYFSPPSSFLITSFNNGTYPEDIQLSTASFPFSITYGKTYRLSFNAKCNVPFLLSGIYLMKSSFPYSLYSNNSFSPIPISTDWKTHNLYFNATSTAVDAMIMVLLGNSLPENALLHIDDVSFQELTNGSGVFVDVGNIIFDNATSFGGKKWGISDLQSQGDFWYDSDSTSIKMYSMTNPAVYYSEIECALSKHIIDVSNSKHLIIDNLEIKYGGAHGVFGSNTRDIVIRECDISYIGGGALNHYYFGTVRYGNGIEFWSNAQNIIVEKCHIYEIYDAAITNQNEGNQAIQRNIIYRNNLIRNSEYSFEYWNRPSTSITQDIYFVNNTCVDAGHGWAHEQRPDKRGRHLAFYESEAITSNFNVLNNIFYRASHNCLFICNEQNIHDFNLNYNLYYPRNVIDTMIYIQMWCVDSLASKQYTMNQFNGYQSDYNSDVNSISMDPEFYSFLNNEFNLIYSSPCINAGMVDTLGIPIGCLDFYGNQRVQQGRVDIGCYESNFATKIFQNIQPKAIVTIFPNPFSEVSTITSDTYFEDAFLTIFNINGQVVWQGGSFFGKSISLYRGNLADGLYFITIVQANKAVVNEKIIINGNDMSN